LGTGGLTAGLALVPDLVAAQRGTPVATVTASDLAAATDQFVRTALPAYGVPGAAVAVVLNDQVVLARGYGVRRLGAPGAVDADTIFQLGSNTKPFTAAALGTVVDQGTLGWDDPVLDHLPGFALFDPYPTRYATIRDLLAHRTGLPAFGGDLLGYLGYDRPEVLRRVRFIPPGHSFREVAAYSNIGYFVAGQVLAQATNATWEEAVTARLLTPLGLTRTAPSAAVDQAGGNVAANHALIDGTLQPIPWDPQTVIGAAGTLTSTATDMARWMRLLLAGGSLVGHAVLTPATVQAILAPSMVAALSFSELPPITDQSGFSYGLGWATFHDQGYVVVEKGGALSGVRSVVELVPQLKLGVAVLSNRNLVPLPEAIRAFVLAQAFGLPRTEDQALIRQRTADLLALLTPTPLPAHPAPPSLPLDAYVGTYENDLYGRFAVVRAGSGLGIEAGPGRYPGTLVHFGRDTFLLSWPVIAFGQQQLTFAVGPEQPTGFDTETLGRFTRPAS
jgi:CubicO group peptidase (beta-lactamase class C family)